MAISGRKQPPGDGSLIGSCAQAHTRCQRVAKEVWWILRRVFELFSKDNCPLIAGAMAFFGLLSLFPLLLLALSIVGRVLGSSTVAEDQVQRFFHLFIPESADSLMIQIRYIAHHTSHRLTETLGLIGLLWSGSHVFDYLERVLNHAWDVPRRRSFLKRKLVTLGTFLVAGVLFAVSMCVSATVASLSRLAAVSGRLSPTDVPWLWNDLSLVSPWIMSLIMFFLIYKFLPNTRVPTMLAASVSTLATVLWEASKTAFTYFASRSEAYGWIYGSLTGTVLVMIWIYVSSVILLLGAEVACAWQEWRERPCKTAT
ncbi:MAG: YihY/virulence factor BrkB family protein [Armatimonadetes bacterium]|nr:YihY/virulence factor BrkB family protein [Armatimonadota bacterium]